MGTEFESWLHIARQHAFDVFHRDWPVENKDIILCFNAYFSEGIDAQHAVEQELDSE